MNFINIDIEKMSEDIQVEDLEELDINQEREIEKIKGVISRETYQLNYNLNEEKRLEETLFNMKEEVDDLSDEIIVAKTNMEKNKNKPLYGLEIYRSPMYYKYDNIRRSLVMKKNKLINFIDAYEDVIGEYQQETEKIEENLDKNIKRMKKLKQLSELKQGLDTDRKIREERKKNTLRDIVSIFRRGRKKVLPINE